MAAWLLAGALLLCALWMITEDYVRFFIDATSSSFLCADSLTTDAPGRHGFTV
jgi:hypothetical protein